MSINDIYSLLLNQIRIVSLKLRFDKVRGSRGSNVQLDKNHQSSSCIQNNYKHEASHVNCMLK